MTYPLCVAITQRVFRALSSDGVLFGRGMHHGGIIALTPLQPLSSKRFRWFGISLSLSLALSFHLPSSHSAGRGGGEHEGGWVFDLGALNIEEGGVFT